MKDHPLEDGLARALPVPLRPSARLAVLAARLWVSEGGPLYGAAIAFYTMFALAPLLVLAIWIAGLVFGAEAARGGIGAQIETLVGPTAARGIEALVASAWREPGGGIAGLLALLALLLGASGVFVQLRHALNAMMGGASALPSPVTGFVRARLVAFVLVLGFGILAIGSLLASAALAAFGAWLSARLPWLSAALALADVALSTLVIAAGFAALLRWLPDAPPSWRAIRVGAFAAALLFSLGKHGIGLYLGRAGIASGYGAAGSFVVVMLWMYYSAQILLYGASLGRVLDAQAPGAGTVPREPIPLHGEGGPDACPARGASPAQDGGGLRFPHGSATPGGAKVLPFVPAARSRRGRR